MSFNRNVFFERKKVPRKKNHKWRKFQKSKKGIYIATDAKGKIIAESDSYDEFNMLLKTRKKRR